MNALPPGKNVNMSNEISPAMMTPFTKPKMPPITLSSQERRINLMVFLKKMPSAIIEAADTRKRRIKLRINASVSFLTRGRI